MLALLLAAGCGSDPAPSGSDAGRSDAAPMEDARPADAGRDAEPDAAEPRTLAVEYEAGGLTVAALLREPAGDGPVAAVVYNHGLIVENLGLKGARDEAGYDVEGFVVALADAGYLALAPIRPAEVEAYGVWRDIVRGGIDYARALARTDRVFLAGFSKGGLLTLMVAVEDDSGLDGLLLFSPAPGASPDAWSDYATDENLAALGPPVLVTLGALEVGDAIGDQVVDFVDRMTAIGSDVTFPDPYADAEHRTFYGPFDPWWGDVVGWLDAR